MIKKTTSTGLDIYIRPEMPDEHENVNELVREAFTHSYGENTAAEILKYFTEVRKKDVFIPELSLVALLEDGKMAGQITLYETDIVTDSGKVTQLVLSQCAVLPGHRNCGIMREMVTFALSRAKEMGYVAVFLGGPGNLYSKFGFEPSYRYGIHHEKSEEIKGYKEGYMVCVLVPGALDGITGATSYFGG